MSEWQTRVKNMNANTLQGMVQIYGKKITKEKKASHALLYEDSDYSIEAKSSKCQLLDNAYQRQLPKRMSNDDLHVQDEMSKNKRALD